MQRDRVIDPAGRRLCVEDLRLNAVRLLDQIGTSVKYVRCCWKTSEASKWEHAKTVTGCRADAQSDSLHNYNLFRLYSRFLSLCSHFLSASFSSSVLLLSAHAFSLYTFGQFLTGVGEDRWEGGEVTQRPR